MREMKDSGVEWIGKCPSSWQIQTIGSLFKVRNEKVNDTEYPPLSVTKNGIVPQMENVAKSDANDNRKMVLADDFVINSRSDRKQSCGVSSLDGSVSLINMVLYPAKVVPVVPTYMNYLLKNYGFAEEFYRWGHGIVADLWTTRWQEMKSILLPMPSMEEQQQILEILDKKMNDVDRLIGNVQKQIEKLKAYKQSLITEVVTKGLDSTVPMKDSGVEWIGEMPKHWKIEKLKFNVSVNAEKQSGLDLPYIALEHIEGFSGKRIETDSVYEVDDAIVAHSGEVLFGKLRPYLAKVYKVEEETYVSSEFAVFSAETIDNQYLKWYMLSYGFLDTVNASTYGTKMPRANIDFVKNMYIPVFDVQEQEEIAIYLNEKSSQIEQLIAIKKSKIDKLEQYKRSLIYEYVTGKKEVS